MKNKLRLATRKSPMALWQANYIRERILEKNPELEIELVELVTQGDKDVTRSIADLGGKSVFVKELQRALLNNEADIAVHCVKDMSVHPHENLILGAICEREDPRDAFVSLKFSSLSELPPGGVVGTSSPRRASLIKSERKDLQVKLLRGNVNTRLKKLEDGLYDAIILAAAGLKRLNMENRISEYFSPEVFIPAIGQGALAIECRKMDADTLNLISHLHDETTAICVQAERAVNVRLGGDCHTAVGAHAILDNNHLYLQRMVGDENNGRIIQAEVSGLPERALELGNKLAEMLLAKGARAFINPKNSVVLITRPLHQAKSLQEKIESLGLETVLFPTVEIVSYRDSEHLKKAIEKIKGYSFAIFSSANAVEAVGEYWHLLKIDLPVIAIGTGTAKALSKFQIPVAGIPLEFSSLGILKMPELQAIKNKKIAIFCGENPRPELRAGLLERGAVPTEIYCYRRERPKPDTKNKISESTWAAIGVIISTSRESLQNLHALFSSDDLEGLYNKTLVVISQDMEKCARELGFKGEIYLAKNPSDEAIVEALRGVQ
jgi:hydroxymethylbilane synthase